MLIIIGRDWLGYLERVPGKFADKMCSWSLAEILVLAGTADAFYV